MIHSGSILNTVPPRRSVVDRNTLFQGLCALVNQRHMPSRVCRGSAGMPRRANTFDRYEERLLGPRAGSPGHHLVGRSLGACCCDCVTGGEGLVVDVHSVGQVHRRLAAQRVEQNCRNVDCFAVAETEIAEPIRKSHSPRHCDGYLREADAVEALAAVCGQHLGHQPAAHQRVLGSGALVGVDHETVFC